MIGEDLEGIENGYSCSIIDCATWTLTLYQLMIHCAGDQELPRQGHQGRFPTAECPKGFSAVWSRLRAGNCATSTPRADLGDLGFASRPTVLRRWRAIPGATLVR